MKIAIVGAGPSGLCMGIRLKEAGFEDFVILDRATGVGGTWFHNRYPGCAVDLPSFFYSFSFAKKYDWSRPYAPQSELLAYMEDIADRYGLLPHCRFEHSVSKLAWEAERSLWRVELEGRDAIEANAVVSAVGMFNDLAWPDIPGRDTFEGAAFHSARWDWNVPLAGKRVAVIGSAASATQIIPEIVQEAAQVHLFQRTANWVVPKEDDPYSEAELAAFRDDPTPLDQKRAEYFATVDAGMTFEIPEQMAETTAYANAIREQVKDPLVREALRPLHPYGAKRPLMSNTFYPTFNEPNLELVTDRIDAITQKGIRTADGREREVDVIAYATGFAATKYLSALDVRGENGLHIDEAWSDGASAHLGVTTAGFPNLFMLYGPNTNNGSIIEMIEYQTNHVKAHLERMRDEDLAWVDVRPEVQAAFNERVQKRIAEIPVWNQDVNTYYRSKSGRVVTQWPWSMTRYREMTERVEPDDYRTGRRD